MKKTKIRGAVCALLVLISMVVLFVPVNAQTDIDTLLIQSVRNETWADLSAYKVTEEALDEAFYRLRAHGQFPWYTDYNYTYYIDDDGYIQSFKADYLDPKQYDRVLYEKKVAQLIDAAVKDGMTDLQIALAVHDYLALHCAYDETYVRNTGYDLLVNGSAVCAGYADAYMDILNRLGVECIYVDSEQMDHAWNLVKIDGSWYHVDITWDDRTPDVYGSVSHEYFLLTDEQMQSGEDPHYGWNKQLVCMDARFTDGFWVGVESAVWFDDSKQCYLRTDEDFIGRVYSCEDGKRTQLAKNSEQYVDVGYGEYAYSHYGLSYWQGRLYYSDMQNVWSVKPDGTDRRKEFTYDTAKNRKYIWGSFVENDTIYLSLSDHLENVTVQQVALAPTGYHTHCYEKIQYKPNCVKAGGVSYNCCDCDLSFTMPATPARGHHGVITVTLPQTDTQASLCLQCKDCDEQLTLPLPAFLFAQVFLQTLWR